MNFIRSSLSALVVLIMVATGALAQDSVRIWQSATGERYEAFLGAMRTNGFADEQTVDTTALARLAFAFASENGHLALVPPSNRNEADYVRMFLDWNGMPAGQISLEQFRSRGQRTGFWLPSTGTAATALADAPAPAPETAPETAAAPAPEAAPVVVPDALAALQADLAQLENDLDFLQIGGVSGLTNRLADLDAAVGPLTAENAALRGTLATVERGLEALQNGELTPELQAEMDARIAAQVAALAQDRFDVEIVTGIGDAIQAHWTGFTIHEAYRDYPNRGLALLAALLLLTALATLYFRKRGMQRHVAQSIDDAVSPLADAQAKTAADVETIAGAQVAMMFELEGLKQLLEGEDGVVAELFTTRAIAEGASTLAGKTRDRVTALEEVLYEVTFDTSRISQFALERLAIGEMIPLPVQPNAVSSALVIHITKMSDTTVDIDGIKRRVDGPVELISSRLDKVASVIGKAGREGRIVGMTLLALPHVASN